MGAVARVVLVIMQAFTVLKSFAAEVFVRSNQHKQPTKQKKQQAGRKRTTGQNQLRTVIGKIPLVASASNAREKNKHTSTARSRTERQSTPKAHEFIVIGGHFITHLGKMPSEKEGTPRESCHHMKIAAKCQAKKVYLQIRDQAPIATTNNCCVSVSVSVAAV